MAKRRRSAFLGKTVIVSVKEPPELIFLPNAPSVLVSQCRHLRLAGQVAKAERAKHSRARGLPGPAKVLSLMERLLTDKKMDTVWEQLGHALSGKSESEQNVAYLGLWDVIHYAWARCGAPVAPRHDLENAIREIGKGLRRVGKAIAPYWPLEQTHRARKKLWPGVPSTLLWQCLPDDLAAPLEHWAPHMEHVTEQAHEKAHTILARNRPVDRGGYPWAVFVRLLQAQWPSSLQAQCTHNVLSLIACAAFPDISPTPRQVRDVLRPSPSRRPR